ncbi:MAG: hypothetical protein H6884_03325 [Rhodobiaceae bacterium]|nr:hypothetical protein [Rhodobiaceae bacterium]MCC0053069.1 hypothetical protein [Rhodobiaceae bacterium]
MEEKLIRSLAGLALSALALWAAGTAPARASNCVMESYNHNGSVMEVIWCDNGVNIAYDRPRQSLLKHGVRPGTILFEGQAYANYAISGTARVFNRVCGVATYPVSGNIHPGRIVMHGQAPVRDTSTCAIKRYRDDTLVFDLMP